MDIPQQIIAVLDGKEGQTFSSKQIKKAVIATFGTKRDSIIPSDFCYNRLNKGSRTPYIFERIAYGKYKYLGRDYSYSGDIYARPKGTKEDVVVGFWVNGERTVYAYPSEDEKHLVQSEDDRDFFSEGKEAYRIHREKERSGILPRQKKSNALAKDGSLTCEVCGFDFSEMYGQRGGGFIECHHNKPVSEMNEEQKVSLCDLSLVCSNCHRMIHRYRPWISVDEVRDLIDSNHN